MNDEAVKLAKLLLDGRYLLGGAGDPAEEVRILARAVLAQRDEINKLRATYHTKIEMPCVCRGVDTCLGCTEPVKEKEGR